MISLSRLLWLCSSLSSSFSDISVFEVSDGDSTSLAGFSHLRLLQFGSSLCFVICSVLLVEGLPIIGDFPLFCCRCLPFFLSSKVDSCSVLFPFDELCCNSSFRNLSSSSLISFLLCPSLAR